MPPAFSASRAESTPEASGHKSSETFAEMTTARNISSLPGYEDVRDLIPKGLFLHCTDIWRLSLEFYRDDIDGLRRRMVLELVRDVQDSSADRVAVIMEAPTQISFPNSWQILGLDFEDIRDRGMEGLRWRAYDYEMSGFEASCSSVRLERRTNTEPYAQPNSRPSSCQHRRKSSRPIRSGCLLPAAVGELSVR